MQRGAAIAIGVMLQQLDPVQKGEGDRERERSAMQTENLVARTRRRNLAAASGVGPLRL